MIEQKEWVFFRDIDWLCSDNNRFNVDTRDFHCGYNFKSEQHPDYLVIKKYEKFFYTKDELIDVLERLFVESGGIGVWRMLEMVSKDKRVTNWRLKYLRIWRTDEGFIICNSDDVAIPKDIIKSKINQDFLHYREK